MVVEYDDLSRKDIGFDDSSGNSRLVINYSHNINRLSSKKFYYQSPSICFLSHYISHTVYFMPINTLQSKASYITSNVNGYIF